MATDLIRFVDSIASSPTVRLDVNDGTVWRCGKFDAPPPQLRRAMSSNAMRDGIFVSSSQYDARTLTLELALVHSSEDNAATEWQKLARELDRADNFLMYQPTGATKPVFFRLYRSDVPSFDQFTGGAQAFKKPTIRLLAEPFARGLRVDAAVAQTLAHDPAAGTNPTSFLTPSIIGDAATELLIWSSTSPSTGTYLLANDPTGAAVNVSQGEAATLSTDTTLPGNDAAMSGAGSNYFRTSFATNANLVQRASWNPTLRPGEMYRVLVRARASAAGPTTFTLSFGSPYIATPAVTTVSMTTTLELLDLGVFTAGSTLRAGYAVEAAAGAVNCQLNIGRTSGTASIDVDYVLLVPASSGQLIWSMNSGQKWVVDGTRGDVSGWLGTNPVANPLFVTLAGFSGATGGVPMLAPGSANRVTFIQTSDGIAIGSTATDINISYWPAYMHIRPSAT